MTPSHDPADNEAIPPETTSGQEQGYMLLAKGSQTGPYDAMLLVGMLASGIITADDLIWREGMDEWATVGSILRPQVKAEAGVQVSAPALPPPLPPQVPVTPAGIPVQFDRPSGNGLKPGVLIAVGVIGVVLFAMAWVGMAAVYRMLDKSSGSVSLSKSDQPVPADTSSQNGNGEQNEVEAEEDDVLAGLTQALKDMAAGNTKTFELKELEQLQPVRATINVPRSWEFNFKNEIYVKKVNEGLVLLIAFVKMKDEPMTLDERTYYASEEGIKTVYSEATDIQSVKSMTINGAPGVLMKRQNLPVNGSDVASSAKSGRPRIYYEYLCPCGTGYISLTLNSIGTDDEFVLDYLNQKSYPLVEALINTLQITEPAPSTPPADDKSIGVAMLKDGLSKMNAGKVETYDSRPDWSFINAPFTIDYPSGWTLKRPNKRSNFLDFVYSEQSDSGLYLNVMSEDRVPGAKEALRAELSRESLVEDLGYGVPGNIVSYDRFDVDGVPGVLVTMVEPYEYEEATDRGTIMASSAIIFYHGPYKLKLAFSVVGDARDRSDHLKRAEEASALLESVASTIRLKPLINMQITTLSAERGDATIKQAMGDLKKGHTKKFSTEGYAGALGMNLTFNYPSDWVETVDYNYINIRTFSPPGMKNCFNVWLKMWELPEGNASKQTQWENFEKSLKNEERNDKTFQIKKLLRTSVGDKPAMIVHRIKNVNSDLILVTCEISIMYEGSVTTLAFNSSDHPTELSKMEKWQADGEALLLQMAETLALEN